MQTIKSLLKKEEDPTRALLSYRSTKQLNGYSPAELLFGRNIRTRIPVAESELSPSWQGVSKQVQRRRGDEEANPKEVF